ncbi:dTDP-4-dehydrorhamnose 3,5-epimerase family protein [Gordonia soli]|uniref:Putative dTDP-6-deoxy-D-xylo-4-hexulose 3,5-epimerase n=1 Tax=Gordonia soli NBRC 108243 TaxID=1223545 RepID=M0QKL6_9ACTN|nr:dTDP-4-dehydrorhamnose 3,5-epimerase [Gordonia soli]GAC69185.1 putative dTDP-6-deoxy-D-xylo-4-hexulose 3,5-epimerase [Gordonia soli NBRC 108243]
MQVTTTELAGVLVFTPTPHHDDRGFFTRTFDAEIFDATIADLGTAATAGIDITGLTAADFLQDSQSRSGAGVVRGMHGRSGAGEAKLVRCAHGAVDDVIVDIRPDSPTRGQHIHVRLDDVDFRHVLIPPGFLHGFQALTDADVCYRINRPHDPTEDIGVSYLDADLAIEWSLPATVVSPRDAAAGPLSAIW